MTISTNAIVAVAVAMIAVATARTWALCVAELEDEAADRSNFSSGYAVKNWFISRGLSQAVLIAFCAAALAVTVSVGWLAGALVILGYAFMVRPRPDTRRLIKQRMTRRLVG